MLIKQVFIVTECNTDPAMDLWYQDIARNLQSIFEIKSFLIDLTQVKTAEDLAKQQQEFEIITRSLKDPFMIISHGMGSMMVLQSHILVRTPHIMVAPYLFHSSDHAYEERAQTIHFEAFNWELLEKFQDTFLIELGGDTSIDKISHKEAGKFRNLHFHYIPYDGHGATTGSHNHEIPDLTAEILRIMVQRDYAQENELFLQFKKNLSTHPLHITPAIEIETLTKELALATSESSPAQISELLREARKKEQFFAEVTHIKKDKLDKQIAILTIIFGLVAISVIFITDTVSFIAPKSITTPTGIYIKTPLIEPVKNSTDTVLFETARNQNELFIRKNYLIDNHIPETISVAAGVEDIYLIENPKMPRTILFMVTDANTYLTHHNEVLGAFLKLPVGEKISSEISIDTQLFSVTRDGITLYSTCINPTTCGISTNKNLLLSLKREFK